ncbi:hypothetical protein GCM10027048_23530 [Hymenobacter coalescens]
MRHLFSALGLLALGTLAGCNHMIRCTDDPEPSCYTGTVLGKNCFDGVLIKVDSRYAIGGAATLPYQGDTVRYTNVIAASVPGQEATLTTGTQVYFSIDHNAPLPPRFCTAQMPVVQLPIPHMVLTNVAFTGCQSAGAGN